MTNNRSSTDLYLVDYVGETWGAERYLALSAEVFGALDIPTAFFAF